MQRFLVAYLLLFSKMGEIIAYLYDCEMTQGEGKINYVKEKEAFLERSQCSQRERMNKQRG